MKRVTLFLAVLACACGVWAETVLERLAVSVDEYCSFLNAVATREDAHALWNPLMQDHWWGGIVREDTGASDHPYAYRVKSGYARKPATCVTWESAARYCNWLSFGRPDTGRQELGTTEGDATCGVYDTRAFGTDAFVRSSAQIRRRTDQAYFLPTADEWRAVAFKGASSGRPNVYEGHWALPYPHLADVDVGVTNGLGYVNMLGNVGEWVETRRANSNFFLALGGSLIRGRYSLEPVFQEGDESNRAISSFGFRVAHAPSPVVLSRLPMDGSALEQSGQSKQPNGPDGLWCRIADEGNPRDPIYKVGFVAYTFEMAKYPVTNAEWCEFMNAVGAEKSIALGLYNPDMSTGVCGGIDLVTSPNPSAPNPGACTNQAIKQSNNQTIRKFRPKDGWARRPVVYIGYRDAMRYCNWLQTGDTEQGAYDVSKPNARRNPGALVFIPTDDEWCKAAYHDPTRMGNRKYWDYPCRTGDLPPNDPRLAHACNYLRAGVHLGEKGPFFLAEVEAYPVSDTYYGCRQMAGNVWEWVEPVGPSMLNLRGGSFGYTEFGMGIWNRDEAGFEDELNVFGLRLARAVSGSVTNSMTLRNRLDQLRTDVSLRKVVVGLLWLISGCLGSGFVLGKWWR